MAKPRGRPFQAGNQASKGRPAGSRDKVTLISQELFGEYSEALTRKCIDMSLQGDASTMRLSMERISPPRKDAPIEFDLPEIKTLADLPVAGNAVLRAVSRGELSLSEGQKLMDMVFQSLTRHTVAALWGARDPSGTIYLYAE